jgi:hypothetical protein
LKPRPDRFDTQPKLVEYGYLSRNHAVSHATGHARDVIVFNVMTGKSTRRFRLIRPPEWESHVVPVAKNVDLALVFGHHDTYGSNGHAIVVL